MYHFGGQVFADCQVHPIRPSSATNDRARLNTTASRIQSIHTIQDTSLSALFEDLVNMAPQPLEKGCRVRPARNKDKEGEIVQALGQKKWKVQWDDGSEQNLRSNQLTMKGVNQAADDTECTQDPELSASERSAPTETGSGRPRR